MQTLKGSHFDDRRAAAEAARKALLEKFKARPDENDPAFRAKLEERRVIAEARAVREAEKKRAKEEQARLDAARKEAERKAAEEAARLAAEAAAKLAEEEARIEAELKAEAEARRKAEKDAMYAARKERRKDRKEMLKRFAHF